MTISSRTPEGDPNRCPVCGKRVVIEPSRPPGDAPCPHCGHLLWFVEKSLPQGTPEGVCVLAPLARDLKDELNILGWEVMVRATADRSPQIVLNLASMEFLSTSALGMLIRLHARLKKNGGTLRLCCLRPELQKVFKITGLKKVLDIYPDERSALGDLV